MKSEEAAPDQAASLAASTVEVNPMPATAEHNIAEAVLAIAGALPAAAGGWDSTAEQAAVTAQTDASARQRNASAA